MFGREEKPSQIRLTAVQYAILVIFLVLAYGLYLILYFTGEWWWLWATAGWLLVTLVLGRLLPVVILPLFYKVTPLDDASLLDRLQKLTEGTTLSIEGVYGARMTGGGFGGCTVNLVNPAASARFEREIAGKYETETPIAPKLREFEALLEDKLSGVAPLAS